MKRYLLFAGDTYYPSGGMDDFRGDFDTVEDAQEVGEGSTWDWAHVLDTKTGKVERVEWYSDEQTTYKGWKYGPDGERMNA